MSDASPVVKKRSRFPLSLALVYAFFASLWIFFSDRILETLVGDPAQLTKIQTFKGEFFILVTSWLLYLCARRHERRLAASREQAAQQEQRFRVLFDRSYQYVALLTSEGKIENVNRRACELIRMQEPEVVGRLFWETRWWNDTLRHRQQVRDAVERAAQGQVVRFESSFEGRRGQVRFVDVAFTPVTDASGQVQNILAEGRDVTERRGIDALYRDFIEGTDDLVTRVDREGKFLFVNHRAREVYGLEPEDCIGLSAFSFIHPEDREATQKSFRQWVAEKASSVTFENRQVSRSGKVHHFLWTINLHFTPKGEVDVINSIARDITERKQAEQALYESESLFRQTFESAGIGMALVGVESGSTFWRVNQAMVRMFGYSESEFRGLTIADITHPEDRDESAMMKRRLLAGEFDDDVYHLEKRYLKKGGELMWAIVSVAVIRDASGEARHLIGEIQDISDRKEAEQTLVGALAASQEARGKLDAILRSVADPLVVTDDQGGLALLNKPAEKLFGAVREEVLSGPVGALDGAEPLTQHLQEMLSSDELFAVRDLNLFDRVRGDFCDYQARSSLVLGPEGRKLGVFTILQDVSRERRVDRMKTEFVSTAAHELRTPLTAILGFSELIQQQPELDAATRDEYLEHVVEKGWALTRIVDDLLDVSRIEAQGAVPLHLSRFDLGELLREVVGEYETRPGAHRFDLELDSEACLMADRGKVWQMVDNVLSNAVKYSPEGGTVRCRLQSLPGALEVEISDEGIGMTPEQTERVFEKFYRADASDSAVGGTGLGMSIVRQVARSHGGEVWVQSEYGSGSTVRIRLPLNPGVGSVQAQATVSV